MATRLKERVRNTSLYDLFLRCRQYIDLVIWAGKGKAGPVPHLIKRTIIKEYARKFNIRILVETGTFLGEMVLAMRKEFDRIISIELSEPLYRRARRNFAPYPHIEVMQGDSSKVLPGVLSTVDQPIMFWLDAHYSAGFTARSEKETPVCRELAHIFHHHIFDHVVLIDDARCFTGYRDYPTVNELEAYIRHHRPDYHVEVRDDIVRIHPGRRPFLREDRTAVPFDRESGCPKKGRHGQNDL